MMVWREIFEAVTFLLFLAEFVYIVRIYRVDREALALQRELKGSYTEVAEARRRYYAGKLKKIAEQARTLAAEAEADAREQTEGKDAGAPQV